MARPSKFSTFFIVVLGLMFVCTVEAKTQSSKLPPSWNAQMQELEHTLVDAYPFFFTLTAFRAKENHKTVLKHIEKFKARIHDVPVSQGELILGDEPLVRKARERMEQSVIAAETAYKAQDFDRAQAEIHNAVNKCVGCHTAQGHGIQFARLNDEMFNIFTPTENKIVGLIAIRQFDGALKAVEKSFAGKSKFVDPEKSLMSLAKMHLLVSLRAMGSFERAQKILDLAVRSKKLSADEKVTLTVWAQHLKGWQSVQGQPSEKQLTWINQQIAAQPISTFLLELLKTRILHNSLATKLDANAKATAYFSLAKSYKSLGLSVLNDLPGIYFQACVEAGSDTKQKAECASGLGSGT